jgi:NAD(P)-dependent dehydrogenase (short-subunit alcohol dehydrogenase family)
VSKRVIVVGAASGIGAHTLARFVERGDEVTAVDYRKPSGFSAQFVECDLRDPASIELAEKALPHEIDAVAHVAGIPGTWPDEQVLAVNFLGLRQLLSALAPKMRPGGAITVVASTAGAGWYRRLSELEPLLATDSMAAGLRWLADNPPQQPVYNLSKAATIAWVKRWSVTLWREQRVRLNAVSPGSVETPILVDFEKSMGKATLDAVRDAVGRNATTADVVPVIEALSDPAFGWVIGQDVQVDGGFAAGLASGAITFENP